MNAEQFEKLEEKISRQWAWRLRDIDAYRKLLDSTSDTSLDLLCRMGIVLLYSHWEGFIKSSAKLYMEIFKGEKIKNVPINIKIANYIKIHDRYKQKYSIYDYGHNILKDISEDTIIQQDITDLVSPESNLNADVLTKITSFLGIGKEWFKLRKNYINNFVACRHAIAHGDRRDISPNEVNDYINGILNLIDIYKTRLLDISISLAK